MFAKLGSMFDIDEYLLLRFVGENILPKYVSAEFC